MSLLGDIPPSSSNLEIATKQAAVTVIKIRRV